MAFNSSLNNTRPAAAAQVIYFGVNPTNLPTLLLTNLPTLLSPCADVETPALTSKILIINSNASESNTLLQGDNLSVFDVSSNLSSTVTSHEGRPLPAAEGLYQSSFFIAITSVPAPAPTPGANASDIPIAPLPESVHPIGGLHPDSVHPIGGLLLVSVHPTGGPLLVSVHPTGGPLPAHAPPLRHPRLAHALAQPPSPPISRPPASPAPAPAPSPRPPGAEVPHAPRADTNAPPPRLLPGRPPPRRQMAPCQC